MISFYKAHGLGNDFVIFEAPRTMLWPPPIIRKIADRRHGIGCDQVIVYHPTSSQTYHVRFYNSDGSEAAACGNGARALGKLLFELNKENLQVLYLQTAGGMLELIMQPDHQIQVKLPPPKFHWTQIPQLQEELHQLPIQDGQISPYYTVNIGNPHLVAFFENIDLIEVETLGQLLENNQLFPQRINVSFAQIINEDQIKVSVWERGSGLTGACGTAACATAVIAIQQGLVLGPIVVQQLGGNLLIDWQKDLSIMMSGAAVITFQGEIDLLKLNGSL